MNRLDWTDWARDAALEMDRRQRREFLIGYGEWLEERLKVLDDSSIEALEQEFCLDI